MHEDPVAKRNRGSNRGLWVVAALATVLVALLIVYISKPEAAVTVSPLEPAPVTAAQRVQDDEARLSRQDAARRSGDAEPDVMGVPPRG